MSTSVKYIPVIHENKETRGIIGTDQMNLNIEMPDEYKIWLSTQQTNISSRGVSFQSVNTNKFIDSNMRLDMTFELVFTGNTITPAATTGSPPVHWGQNNSGVDPLCLNKLINRISFNIQNKQWSEEQRLPELFDILSTQFDCKKLAAEGIFPHELQGNPRLSDLLGRGTISRKDASDINFTPSVIGMTNALAREKDDESIMARSVTNGYVTVDSVTFTQSGGPALGARYDSRYGCLVPYNIATGNQFYTGAAPAQPLVQTVVLTIHEYLISPSLSNPYTWNEFSKSYYVGSYPVNLTLDFNTAYLAAMFKNMLYSGSSTGSSAVTSVTPTEATLNFYTFDTSKELTNPYQRVLYYDYDFQNARDSVVAANSTALQQSRFVTSNLPSLPPYIMGWVSARMFEDNPAYITALGAPQSIDSVASYVNMPLENLRIQYGSQTDCMLGVNLTWREITDLTLSVGIDPELRGLIRGSWPLDQAASVFDSSRAGIAFANAIGATGAYLDLFWEKVNTSRQGMTFFILPTAKLNWRPILQSDVALIPEFNFGSTHYKSLIIEMDWRMAPVMSEVGPTLGTLLTTNITCKPYVALLTKRVRSIPMDGQGPLFDERVEYDYFNNTASLSAILESFYMRNNSETEVNHELQYVGGAFMGDVIAKVKSALPSVASAVRAIHSATRGSEGLLRHVHGATGLASNVLSSLGAKRRVGRPRGK
ncbi:MAG: hypothetical protein ABWZ79_05890 [Pedobacter agri]